MKYAMTCSCGDEVAVEAASRDEAVGMIKGIMNQAGIDQHFAQRHAATEAKPSVEQTHAMIEQLVAAK